MRRLAAIFVLLAALTQPCAAQWLWSTPVEGAPSSETGGVPNAFMWIPDSCQRVRAVVVGQHNMSEITLFDMPEFRERMAELDFAIVLVSPILDMAWDVRTGCDRRLDAALAKLALKSGYDEIATAPIIPVGHSALATFPWNFAAWNPSRTLAVVSLHGDAPRTRLTGYGRENLEWGRTRNIDGIPALMIMGEYEWWEDRLIPALGFQMNYPGSCISFLGDAGRGHFDISHRTALYIARFLEKAADARLDDTLRRVDPLNGWLAQRWNPTDGRRVKAAPVGCYRGDKHDAFWYFDAEMALEAEGRYAETRGKHMRHIGLRHGGSVMRYAEESHADFQMPLCFEEDGLTFHVAPFFSDSTRRVVVESDSPRPRMSVVCGPVEQVGDTTFRLAFDRTTIFNPRRGSEIWLLAEADGDKRHKSSVQQLVLNLPHRLTAGEEQTIDFPTFGNMCIGDAIVQLRATASSGLEVGYMVEYGPAVIRDGRLHLLPVPPRTRFPVEVSVVAWQYGVKGRFASAQSVRQIIKIYKR